MMKLGITNAKIAGFISTFFLLLLSYFLLFFNTQKLIDQSKTVYHTNQVINNLEYLVSQIKEVEYNYHGFIATGNEAFTENFKGSVRRTDSLYNLLHSLTKDSKTQQARLDTIKTNMDERSAIMNNALNILSNSKNVKEVTDSLYTIEYLSKKRTELRKEIRAMQSMENEFLQKRTEKLESFSAAIKIINIISIVLAFMLAVTSYLTYRRENKAGMEAYHQSERYKTELEKRVQQLADANKEIKELRNIEKFASTGRIARTIAHEVRNPLTNINLASEQLKESIIETEENAMLLDMVKRNSLRINQLISNLLDATKFSELSYKKISLNDLLDKSLEFAADRISLKHIQVVKSYAPNICDITLDEEKMKIAFLNIIVNAIEAMKPEGGVLTITTEVVHEKCRVIFQDNGIGMNEETVSKLFEPYFTNKDNGNGLGLTNTQNIVLNHKGKMEVESEEGVGSRFVLILDMN